MREKNQKGKITYQEVDLGALVDDAHEEVCAKSGLQGVHPVAVERQDADVEVHLDALTEHLHLHGGVAVRAAAAQLDVVPQVAGVLDEGLLDVRLGDDGDPLEADDVLGAEDPGSGVEGLGSAGGGAAGRGLEGGWGLDDAGSGGDVLGAGFGEGPVRGRRVEDGEGDVVIEALHIAVDESAAVEISLSCCQRGSKVTRVDNGYLPKR